MTEETHSRPERTGCDVGRRPPLENPPEQRVTVPWIGWSVVVSYPATLYQQRPFVLS